MISNKTNMATFFKLFKLSFEGEICGVLKARLDKGNYCYGKPGRYKDISGRKGPDCC
jgi:hypothetical protein